MPFVVCVEAAPSSRLGQTFLKSVKQDPGYQPPTLDEDMESFCALDLDQQEVA